MTNREQLIEAMARAIATGNGSACARFDFANCPDDNVGECVCMRDAKAALTAIEQAGGYAPELRNLLKEACNMLSTLGDEMDPSAEDRAEIEEFIGRAGKAYHSAVTVVKE